MSLRTIAVGVASLAVGLLLGSMWNRGPAAPRVPDDGIRRTVEADEVDAPERKLQTDTKQPSESGPTSTKQPSAADPLIPEPGLGRAKIEFDFRGVPENAWNRCLAAIEGTGLDGSRLRREMKPYPEGLAAFEVPAGRWRATWRTSSQLRDQRGRILRLKADDDVRVEATDAGDPVETWIWPGLGMLEVVVLGPTGEPLANAPVVTAGRALSRDASHVRTTTDRQGRCRQELRPGRFEVVVGWKRQAVTTRPGEIVELRMDGRQTGSLVVLSDRPEASRIRPIGTKEWRRPNPAVLGEVWTDERRFDLLPAGDYEIAVERGSTLVGTATVRNGAETRFQIGGGR